MWTARPVEVIEDGDDALVTYLAPHTVIEYPAGVEHGVRCFTMWLSDAWRLAAKVFEPPGVLRIAPHGRPFEVLAPVGEEGGVTSWYVNFQRPLRRTELGFDTMDETLDLLVDAGCTHWVRKDEDELALARAMGVYDDDDVKRIVAACAAVEASLAEGAPPWDLRWRDWAPPAPR